MAEDEYAVWASKLHKLSSVQKVDLARRMATLGIAAAEPLPELDLSSDWLLDGILMAMRSRGLLSTVSRRGLLSGRSYRVYARNKDAIYKELENHFEGVVHDRMQRLLLAQTIGHSLINACGRMRLPQTPTFILRRTPYIMEALEMSYPGYARAGLLRLIIGGL